MAENYILLERTELNASAASVTFSNIPQTGYTDLKLVCSTRSDSSTNSGVYDNTQIYVNGNSSGSNYSNLRLYGTGSSTGSDSNSSAYYTGASTGNAVTANTFANSEYYFANYNSTTAYKTMSSDSTTENNATAVFQTLSAWLYKQNTAISSITVNLFSGANFVAGSTFSLYGIAALGTTPVIAPKASGGNVIATDGTYWYHAFLSSGNFVPQANLTCDALVIAGGGAGGANAGGGGAAGGLRNVSVSALANTLYAVTVGAGGSGTNIVSPPTSGSDSVFSTVTSTGGGRGGSNAGYVALTGGSGGGGGMYDAAYDDGAAGNTPSTSPSQGSNGGNGSGIGLNENASGGGGGGATANGGNASNGTPGNGGAGSTSFSTWASTTGTGASGNYAGGGGGGAWNSTGATSTGGSGGGGAGGRGGNAGYVNAVSGTTNTGGGGGGGGTNSSIASGNGGSGIVIIRYPIAS